LTAVVLFFYNAQALSVKSTDTHMKEKKVSIHPLGDRVVIEELVIDEKSKKTASGIFIPDTVNQDKGAKQGKVIAVGPGKYIEGTLVPLEVKIGDTVLFQWGDKITLDGHDYYVVADSSLMATVA